MGRTATNGRSKQRPYKNRILRAFVGALLAAPLFFLASPAHAQTPTTVTGCIVDPNGIKYTGGSFTVNLVGNGGTQPSVNGVPISGSFGPSALDLNGCVPAIGLYANSVITPAGTKWQFTINNPGANPPVGFGPVSFTASPITIAGATQSVTTQLTAAALVLLQVGSAGGGVTSLNAETGAITLTSAGHTVTITTPSAHVINLEVAGGGSACTGTSGQLLWMNGAACVGLAGSTALVTGGVTLAPPATGPVLILVGAPDSSDIERWNVTGGTPAASINHNGGLNVAPPATGVAGTFTGAPDGSDVIDVGINTAGANGINITASVGATGFAVNMNAGSLAANLNSFDTNGANGATGYFTTAEETDSAGSGAEALGGSPSAIVTGTNVAGDQAVGENPGALDLSTGGAAALVASVLTNIQCTARSVNCWSIEISANTGVPGVNNAALEIDSQAGQIAIDQAPTDPDFFGLATIQAITLTAAFNDSTSSPGTAGFALTSTGTATLWAAVAAPSDLCPTGTTGNLALVGTNCALVDSSGDALNGDLFLRDTGIQSAHATLIVSGGTNSNDVLCVVASMTSPTSCPVTANIRVPTGGGATLMGKSVTLAGGATLPSGQTETINGSVTDFNGSTGTSGQVATPGAGGQFVWAAPSVSSVFGRTGAVTAVSGDYTLNQIGNPTASTSFTYPSNDNAVETFAGTGIKQIVFPSGLIYNFSDDGSGDPAANVPWLSGSTTNGDVISGVGLHGMIDSGVNLTTVQRTGFLRSCGTTTTCSNTPQPNLFIVDGSVPLTSGAPSTATVTSLPFSTAGTYNCTATEATSATGNLLKIANVSGSSFTITGPTGVSDTISYICAGF